MRATAAAMAWLLATAAPALALDSATGSYEGRIKCAALTGGAASTQKADVTIRVFDAGDGTVLMAVAASPVASTAAMSGIVTGSATRPDRGKVGAVECSLSYSSTQGATVLLDVTIPPGSAKGKLKGTLIDLAAPATSTPVAAALCTFTAKRTSTKAPNFPVCF
jgi:hypothetical protein